jgi:CBS domain containing-hemolysin-like protein
MTLQLLSAILLGGCLLLSFLLSGMEAGVFALSRIRIRQQMRAGKSSARMLHGYLENPENFLWTILVGNTLANFAILGWIIGTLHGRFGGQWILFVAILAVAVFLFYALFDLLPKMLFQKFPNRLCLLAAVPFRFVHLGLRPLVFVVERVANAALGLAGGQIFSGHLFGNREELRQVMQESAQVLTSEERFMINQVLDLQSLTTRQITTPMTEAVTLTASTPVSDAVKLARERNLTRFPVWEVRDKRRRIGGLIDIDKLLFRAELDETKPVSTYLSPALFLEEGSRLEVALRRMQRAGQRLAVVVTRDGREVGIISLEDIFKLMFGEVKL